jgi:hypothetical protein
LECITSPNHPPADRMGRPSPESVVEYLKTRIRADAAFHGSVGDGACWPRPAQAGHVNGPAFGWGLARASWK